MPELKRNETLLKLLKKLMEPGLILVRKGREEEFEKLMADILTEASFYRLSLDSPREQPGRLKKYAKFLRSRL